MDTRVGVERVTTANARECIDVVKVAYRFPSAVTNWIMGVVDRQSWRAYAAFDEGRPIARASMSMQGE